MSMPHDLAAALLLTVGTLSMSHVGLCAARDSLAEAEQAFTSGDYEGAEDLADELIDDATELASSEQARLYLMKARLELAFGRKAALREWLAKMYAADPSVAPDPVVDPPQLHAEWEAVKKSGPESETPDSPPASSASPAPTSDPRPSVRTAASERDAKELRLALSFFPFGVAQAKNAELGKAFGVATLHAALAAVAALTPSASHRRVAAYAFGASWALSAYDGFSNDAHRTRVTLAPLRAPAGTWGAALLVSWSTP